jgi:hypothetical protein
MRLFIKPPVVVRCGYSPFGRPLQDFYPLHQSAIGAGTTGVVYPCSRTLSLPEGCDQQTATTVPTALLLGGPTAIARLVVAVVVLAVQQVFRTRTRPHVQRERLERIPPPAAYFDTPTAVRGVTFIVGVLAAGNHGAPEDVHGGSRLSVGADSFVHGCRLSAPATTGQARLETTPLDDFGPSTVTPTEPVSTPFTDVVNVNGGEHSEPLAAEIMQNRLRHLRLLVGGSGVIYMNKVKAIVFGEV